MATRKRLLPGLTALVISFLLTLGACGGDGGSKWVDTPDGSTPPPGGSPPSGDEIVDNHVTGSVGDGPVVGARVRVRTNNGSLLMEGESTDTADYDMVVRTQGRNYALTVHADRGIDLVTGGPPDFELVTHISRPNTRTISNVNPFTTLIVKTAQRNGGLSDANVAAARATVLDRYGFGLDKAVVPDPNSTEVTNANVHHVVKSSETLGEMVRRTRDAMTAAGSPLDGDAVVAALAADLVDGWIDGSGAQGSSSRLAAVANVASAAVLVEAMTDRLRVEGAVATEAMDQSIRVVRPDAPQSATTSNVPIPAAAFEQAARALQAAFVVNPDARIAAAIEVMASAAPGSLPADIAPQIPSGLRGALRTTTTDTAYASDSVIASVNVAARAGNPPGPPEQEPEPEPPPPDPEPEPPPPEPEPPPPDPEPEPQPPPPNQPPVISGSPQTTALVVGSPWSFTPTASDPDGDALTFSITNRPGWMSFSSSTGRLSGTPQSNHVGVYENIVISVSDGQYTASLPAFTLTVTAPQPATGSATVRWTPPTEREDGSPIGTISNYRIYYSRNSTALNQTVTVSGGLTSYHIENLEAGTWYFAVTTVTNDGLESVKSNTASKTIP